MIVRHLMCSISLDSVRLVALPKEFASVVVMMVMVIQLVLLLGPLLARLLQVLLVKLAVMV